MKHVRLLVLTEDLPQASLTLAQTECFHPDTRPPLEPALTGLPMVLETHKEKDLKEDLENLATLRGLLAD
ncbi:MAG: hypothetical protein JZU52_19160 [Lamprocystis purpurea]|nr:hypothetical protein [Lamprocystis purpurea]